ncbi:MAG: 4-diphosphocytidyl-2-C-methyl-D-erythritol kinase [Ilumatobacteraceae bacterium]
MGRADAGLAGSGVNAAVVVAAPAKLTLSLRVMGVRSDGYHLIDAEMVSLEWHDTLTIDPTTAGLTVDGPYAAGVPLDESNLVAAALRHVGRTAGVHIHKALPHGGGLGGGSADAAAVLRWAGYDDVAGAATLSSDVAFCLVGGRARVRGIGELVEVLPFESHDLTLVVPPISAATPAVYRMWDALGGVRTDGPNDLEPAALAVYPALATCRDRIREAAGRSPILAGSGATWFLHGHHDLAGALPDCNVVHTAACR